MPISPAFRFGAIPLVKVLASGTICPSYERSRKKAEGAHPNLRFSGTTWILEGRSWVSPDIFQKLLHVSATPYVGRCPSDFTRSKQVSPQQVCQALDEIVPFLRGVRALRDFCFEFHIGHSNKPMTLQYVDRGSFGTVYQLTFNHHPYALKVYHSNHQVATHGTFGESATGLYFSQKALKDISRYYFGNPQLGWGVYEFITPEMSVDQRKGKSINDFPVLLEDNKDKNHIHGIRVDYGGICKAQETPTIRNFDDYKLAMESKEPTVQLSAVSQIGSLPNELRKEAFQLAMESKKPTIQASAASQIGYLPFKFRKEAFLMAMKTQEPTVQLNAASLIGSLPLEFKIEAFKIAIETQKPTILASAASQIESLPLKFRKEAVQIYIQAMEAYHAFNNINRLKVISKNEKDCPPD
jgi:hypothetical protein